MGAVTDGRNACARVLVEPLGRALLSGVPAFVEEGEPPRRCSIDLGIVPLFSDERPLTGLAGFFDWRSSGMLSRLLRTQWCTGGLGETVLMPARRTLPVARIVVFGLGRSALFDAQEARRAASAMVAVAQRLSPRDVMLAMPGKGQERAIVEAVFDAALTALRAHGSEGEASDARAREWWVIADPRHVARLKRVLDGPPRAAAHPP